MYLKINQIGVHLNLIKEGLYKKKLCVFTTCTIPKDNVLEPKPIPARAQEIYPAFEGDLALGQSGAQKIPWTVKVPTNYHDIDVTNEIKAIGDADGIEADVYGLCNNNNVYCTVKKAGWDLGFCAISPFIPSPPGIIPCLEAKVGDNHAGYIGFRNLDNTDLLADDGAMNVAVTNWLNETN